MELQTQIVEKEKNIFNDTDKPDYGESRTMLFLSEGIKYFENGDVKKAKNSFLKILKIDDNNIDANFNLGVLNRDKTDYQKALIFFTKCNDVIPNNFMVIFNIAYCNEMLKQYKSAIDYYEEAQKISDDNYELFFNLGNIYKNLKDWKNAKINYAKSLSLKPDNTLSLNNYASAFFFTGFFDEAIKLYNKVLELEPDDFDAKINYAAALVELQKFDEALQLYQSLLKVKPNDAELHYNYAILLLLLGDEYKGLQEYEWRLENESKYNAYPEIPFWDNQNLKGKTIVVIDEQGIGDAFQFVRYLQLLKKDGAEVIFSCRKEITNFMIAAKVADKVIPLSTYVKADYKIYLMSLPLKYVEQAEKFKFPYLKFDRNLFENKSIAVDKQKLNVGIVWRGNPEHMYDFKRSVKIEDFSSLLSNKKIKLFSLQKDISSHEREFLISNKITDLNFDFIKTANIINQLDLIISVDTAVAHLAGALNKKTFMLLSKVPDWRWGLGTNTTQSYPSVKLFRQNKFNDWSSVIENVKKELVEKVENFNNQKAKTGNTIARIKKLLDEYNFETAKNELLNLVNQNPQSVEANFYLGYIFQLGNNLEKAASYYSKVLSINPAHFAVLNNLSVVLKDLGRFKEAEEFLNFALVINEKNPSVYNNLGIVYDLIGDFKKAIENFQKAIEINLKYQDALLNYANTLRTIKQYSDSITVSDKLLLLNPDHVGGNFNKSLTLLSMGEYKHGFELYEWRRQRKDYSVRKFSKPELTNQNVNGKTILVYDEQGLGDTIQFCRYVKLLADKNAKVILQCNSALSELMKGCSGVNTVLARESLEDIGTYYDYHIPLLSLPKYFGTALSTVPKKTPYINISENLVKKFKHKYFNNDFINVGIVWEGKTPVGNAHRACSIDNFSNLVNNKLLKLFSLQKGEVAERDKQKMDYYGIIDLSEELKTFNETAAIIKNLNFVITIDTSVAHLAGALGAETYLLLPYKYDWRWSNDGDYSVWYPTMKMIKQNEFGNWTKVFDELNFLLNRLFDADMAF